MSFLDLADILLKALFLVGLTIAAYIAVTYAASVMK